MALQLSNDLQKEIDSHAGLPVQVGHPGTHRLYVIVDHETHERAMQALREREDIAAIARGIKQMEAGEGRPLAEVDAEIREEFNFPPRDQ